jgi:DNA-binding transcriptional MerR regulator
VRQAEMCRLAGITHRQLDQWIAKGIIGLSAGAGCNGSGNHRVFNENDVEIIVRIAHEKRTVDDRMERWMERNFEHRFDNRRFP